MQHNYLRLIPVRLIIMKNYYLMRVFGSMKNLGVKQNGYMIPVDYWLKLKHIS